MSKILVTGCAGNIGSLLIAKLLEDPTNQIIGLDRICPCDDINEKYDNLAKNENDRFTVFVNSICNKEYIDSIFERNKFDIVYHLATIDTGATNNILMTNIIGFNNIIEAAIKYNVSKLFYLPSMHNISKHTTRLLAKENTSSSTEICELPLNYIL